MVVQTFTIPTNVTKEGRKKEPAPAPSGGGGGGGGAAAAAQADPFAELDRIRAGTSTLPQADQQNAIFTELDKIRAGTSTLPQAGQESFESKYRLLPPTNPIERAIYEGGRVEVSKTFAQTAVQKIKDRILLDFAALGVIEPPPGVQITGATMLIPSGAIKRPFVSLYSKELVGLSALKKAGTGVAINTVTKGLIKTAAAKVSGKVFWRALGALGLAAYFAEKIFTLTYGGKNFGQFVGQEEAAQSINIAATAAYYAGNEEAYAIAKAARDEVLLNDSYWDGMESLTPYANLATGLDTFRDTTIVAGQVLDKLAKDKFAALEEGLTEAQEWERAQKEHLQDEIAYTNFINEQRLITEERIRTAEKEQRNEDAKFWRKEQERQRKQEIEDTKAMADFWLQYQIQKQKLIENNRPSNLNFGLLG